MTEPRPIYHVNTQPAGNRTAYLLLALALVAAALVVWERRER